MMRKNGFSQLRKLLPVVAVCALALTVGCSDDDDTTKPPSEFAPPSNLTFSNNARVGRVDLSWTASPDQSAGDFAGYNVYQSPTSLAGMTGAEADSFKVAGSPFSTTTRSVTVPRGERFFYSVRAVKDNGDLSEASNEVDTSLPASGDDFLVEFADKTGNSGMDLSEGTTYSVMIDNLVHIDFFLGTTDDENDEAFELAIKSPSLIGGPNAAQWATRQAGFKLIDDPDASTTSSAGFIDSVTLTPAEVAGKAIIVRLPADENGETHYGKISNLEFEGEPGQRSMIFAWTYQAVNNYIRF
jgi:hypothetical protein